MHEFSILKNLCDQVLRLASDHRAERVSRIVVEVGEQMHGTPEHWQETFSIFRETNPLLAETQLEFRVSPDLKGEEMLLRDVELDITEDNHDTAR